MGSSNALSPDSDESPPPPPDSSSNPPPEDSSPPPPVSSPPPTKSSPPPPEKSSSPPPPTKSSSPPPSPPSGSPPPPENSPPPPSNPSSPPSSPTPTKKSPPPPATTETPPMPEVAVTNSPPPPVEGGAPPAPAGDLIKSPPAFVPPASTVSSNGSAPTTGGNSMVSSPSSSGGSSVSGVAVAGAIVGGLVFFILVVCLWVFCKRKKKTQEYYNKVWNTPSPDYKHHTINIPGVVGMSSVASTHLPQKSHIPGIGGGYSPYLYLNRSPGQHSQQGRTQVPISPDRGGFSNQNCLPYDDVVAATNGFANANMLGQGGFGFVHKGVMSGGKEVAVKSLKSGSGQGEREFQAEVDIISRVHHRHLVSLVGYCIAADKRLLVYEFVPNNTLEYHLHNNKEPVLDFPTRVRIALGSAKGLAYLHEDCHPRIIHRDIKAANILLDYNFEAQVADFGLARLYNDTNTHISTRVMGTFGYLAPEYASSGKLTDKSDVFSFGVVLLELITGRRPIDPNDESMEDCSLVDWARPLLSKALSEGQYDELVDPHLEKNYYVQDMASMVACAAASIRHSNKRRPRMSQIVRALEGDMSLEALDGTRSGQGTEYDTAAYNVDLKKFRQMAFGTQTFGGSTSTTSEYGLNPSVSSSNVTSSLHSIQFSS